MLQEPEFSSNLKHFNEGQQTLQSETNLGHLFESNKAKLRGDQPITNGHQYPGELDSYSSSDKQHRIRHHHGSLNQHARNEDVLQVQHTGKLEDFSDNNYYGGQQVLREDFDGQQHVQQEETLGKLEDYGQQVQQKEVNLDSFSAKQIEATKSKNSTSNPTNVSSN